jgi:L-fuculose-phosphate aldolase
MTDEQRIRRDIVEVGRMVYEHGYVAANDGNISARLSDSMVIATPTGVSKGSLTTDMLVKIDLDGRVVEGYLKPSSETKMHLEVYRLRPDVGAVVHAHPVTATAFAVAGIPLTKCVIPEVIISLGWVPLAEYGTPSTDELAASIRTHLQRHDAMLLQNHGAITVAEDVLHALYKMETVEHFARISLYSRLLGGEQELSRTQVARLLEIRDQLGIRGQHPGACQECGACTVSGRTEKPEKPEKQERPEEFDERRLVETVTRVVREALKAVGDNR